MSRQELLDRLRCGSAAVLDVRPVDEFNIGHLPGALNVPSAQLERRLAELPASSRDYLTAEAVGVLSFGAVGLLATELSDTTARGRLSRLEDGGAAGQFNVRQAMSRQ